MEIEDRTVSIYRLRPYQDARIGPAVKPSPWARFLAWLNPPPKAQVFKFRNPTHWKLERIRRKSREAL